MEENEKIIELDEEKIENLDNSTENEKKPLEDIDTLKKKLIRSRIKNILLSIFAVFSILVFIGIGIATFLFSKKLMPLFSSYFSYNDIVASISQIEHKNAINLKEFTKKLAFIDDVTNMLYYYDKDNKKIEDAMFSGYLGALGDKYAEYFPKKEYDEFTEKTTEGVYYGIGCLVTQDRKTKDCTISSVYEDSPADKGGLKEGDVIVAIDDVVVRGNEINDIVEKIKGEEGTARKIEVYRPKEDKNIVTTCYCGKVDIKLVSTKILDDNIGYLDVDEFTGKASSQFKKAVNSLLDQKVSGIIIDLRSNVGGELFTILEMLDYLVRDNDARFTLNQEKEIFETGKALLVFIKDKEQVVDAAYCEDKHEVDLPMVILTDFGTASAAELFTEAMRDYKKATIVGTRTYGKGVVQNIIPYEDGSAIKFTVSEYFPPSGYSIDKKGILPEYSLNYDGDEVMYDSENNIVMYDGDTKYLLNVDGSIKEEIKIAVATNSEIATVSNVNKFNVHKENLKIYDEDNEFINDPWFIDLDAEYDDKQLLQAIIVMKDKLGIFGKGNAD